MNIRENLLRSYIRGIVSEMTRADVQTSKDPLDWITAAYQDPEEWGEENKFLAMKRACDELGLKYLGIGSSRIAYALDSERVVKIAANVAGLKQNELEVVAGNDPMVDAILARVLDYSGDDYCWVVAERVEPLDEMNIKMAEEMTGVAWSEVLDAVGLPGRTEYDRTEPMAGVKVDVDLRSKVSSGCLGGDEFLDAVRTFVGRYKGMLLGDLTKVSSWGRNKRGCLVLLDYGITRQKYDQFYTAGRVKTGV